MKYLLSIIAILVTATPVAAQSKNKDYRSLIEVGAYDGGRIATSVKAADVKEKLGSSPSTDSLGAFWLEARKPEDGPTQVFLLGERVRFITPREAEKRETEYGPWDPPEPVFVGSPWEEADIRYRGYKSGCFSNSYWCWQKWYVEVALPENVIRSVVTNPKKNEVRLSLSNKSRVEWRTPRDELIATLDVLGVIAEFSGTPAK